MNLESGSKRLRSQLLSVACEKNLDRRTAGPRERPPSQPRSPGSPDGSPPSARPEVSRSTRKGEESCREGACSTLRDNRAKDEGPGRRRLRRPSRWTSACLICLVWLGVIAMAVTRLRQPDAIIVAAAGFAATAFTLAISVRTHGADWPAALRSLKHFFRTARKGGPTRLPADIPDELVPVAQEYLDLLKAARRPGVALRASPSSPSADPQLPAAGSLMTRSGLFDAPPVVVAGAYRPADVGRLFDDRHGQSARAGRLALDRVQPGGTGVPRLVARRLEDGCRSSTSSIPTTADRSRRRSVRHWNGARPSA